MTMHKTLHPSIAVLSDDFSIYSEGPFSEGYDAISEFHYPPQKLFKGGWTEISSHHLWAKFVNPDYPNWKIERNGDSKHLRQTLKNHLNTRNWKYILKKLFFKSRLQLLLALPALATGDTLWDDYLLVVDLMPLSDCDLSGILFRMMTAHSHYAFGLRKNSALFLKRNASTFELLASERFPYVPGKFYTLAVKAEGAHFCCYINKELILKTQDPSYPRGKVGLIADVPCTFRRIDVFMHPQSHAAVLQKKRIRRTEESELQKRFPEAKLWKRIHIRNSCSGRTIRLGDLTGNGQQTLLLAQGTQLAQDHNMILCLTAMDLDGNVIWQRGKPTDRREIMTGDLAFQIYDLDGDGQNEVICTMDFELLVLDGQTGEVKAKVPTPLSENNANKFSRIVGDSICIADLRGSGRPSDILLKDRYSKVHAYSAELDMLWECGCNTGHFPFPCDIDSDGRDEILVGYTLLDGTGRKLFQLPLTDHADAVAVVRFPGSDDYAVLIAASDEGLVFADLNGNIRKKIRLGHAQTITIAKLRPDLPGLQIATNTYWGNPGVIYILDSEGEVLHSFQPSAYGSPIPPVDWAGDGSHLLLVSVASTEEGGLYDGFGRQVVSFPDDGHPTLCYDVANITGGDLDDILCWDHDQLWIYRSEQTSNCTINKHPTILPPRYNGSNYRANIYMN
jgi:rhamnogalacturonan endolyase